MLQLKALAPSVGRPQDTKEMAQAMASMAGLRASSQALLQGSLQVSSSSRLSIPGGSRVAIARPGLVVRAQQQAPSEGEATDAVQSGRRMVLGLVAAGLAGASFTKTVLAGVKSIKIGPPPPPSGGLRK